MVFKLTALYTEFNNLCQTRKERRNEKWKEEVGKFCSRVSTACFNISCTDPVRIKHLESFYGVKMTQMEEDFLEDQLSERKMFCTTDVDAAWVRMAERRKKQEEGQEKLRVAQEEEIQKLGKVDFPEDLSQEGDEGWVEDQDETDKNANIEELLAEENDGLKNKKRRFQEEVGLQNTLKNSLHIRNSHHAVRPEFYGTVDTLVSKFHCSLNQAVAGVVETGKGMLGLPWKYHEENKDFIDLDTVPHNSTHIHEGRAREAFAVSEIVAAIMKSSDTSSICYHDDGSKTQGTGAYSVQGVTVEGRYYSFPALSIASETRKNLADLKLTVLALLSICSGIQQIDIWKKVDFAMKDSASHNIHVDEIVSESLGTSHIPASLLCHVHPSLMFVHCITNLQKEVDVALGPEKIFASFAITLGEQQTSVTETCIDCNLRLISHDFNQKAWNKASEFDSFIAPKKNNFKRLQAERFNSYAHCSAVFLYLDENIRSFLHHYPHITNQLSCIVRSFQNLAYVRILSAVTVVMAVHLIEPYISLTSSSITSYSNLVEAFPALYKDLTTTTPPELLNLDKPAFTFISVERFKHCRYSEELLTPVKRIIEENRPEMEKLLKILLPKMAEGWARQRGDMFEFGEQANPEATNKVSDMDQDKLEAAPINNLDAERDVGFINHELDIRGKKNLRAASRSLVKGKALELTRGKVMDKSFKKLTEKEGGFTQIMKEWSMKQEQLKKEGLESKDVANLAEDKTRMKDLSELTKLGGPFTKCEDVREFVKDEAISEKNKNKRLYIEIRHAKKSSLSFPKSSEIFRLKKANKNLETSSYASNLCAYLEKVTCKVNLEPEDFGLALEKLS